MKRVFIILLLSSVVTSGFSQKSNLQKIVADKTTSVVRYDMKHPLHEWDARCKDVNAVIVYNSDTKAIEQTAVSIRVDAFDSGNSNRDSHTLEVLEALKYPKVTFVSTEVVQKGMDLTINGKLTFHNVTKPISIKAIRRDENKHTDIEGLFYVSLAEFNVERPSLLGMKCEDEIKLSFKIEFQVK